MDLRRVVDSQLLSCFFVLVGKMGVTTSKLFPGQGRNGVLFLTWVSAHSLSGHRSIVDFQLLTGVLADFPWQCGDSRSAPPLLGGLGPSSSGKALVVLTQGRQLGMSDPLPQPAPSWGSPT